MSFIRYHFSRLVGIVMLLALSIEPSAAMLTPFTNDDDDFSVSVVEEEKGEKEIEVLDEIWGKELLTIGVVPVGGVWMAEERKGTDYIAFIAIEDIGKIHNKEARVLISIPHPLLYLLFHNFKVHLAMLCNAA